MKSSGGLRVRMWRLLPAALIAGAVVLPPAPTSAAAGASDPTAGMPVQVCPVGDDLFLPVSSSVETDGWIQMTYDIDGGQVNREVPPIAFNALQASDELLARHHLPGRPQGVSDPQWTSKMGSLSWVRTRGLCRNPTISYAGSNRWSYNWGGDEVRPQSNYNFLGARANPLQPAAPWSGVAGCDFSEVVSWVGVGGDIPTDSAMIQTGTTAVAPEYQGGTSGYYAWYELIFPNHKPQPYDSGPVPYPWDPTKPILAGDPLFDSVQVTGSTALVQVWDDRTNVFGSLAVDLLGSQPNSSAEWIDERAGGGTRGALPLTNYGSTHWSNMQVLRSNSSAWTGAYSEPTEWWIELRGASGGSLSKTTGTYSNNYMEDHWKACA
jgi:hypothetical protein